MAEYSKDREGNILTDRAPLYKVVAVMFGMSYSEAKRKIAEGAVRVSKGEGSGLPTIYVKCENAISSKSG